MEKIEYRVRPVTRFIVTRFEQNSNGGSCSQIGEYDNEVVAYQVGYAVCKAEHQRLEWPLNDQRIVYPVSSIPAFSAVPTPT